MCEVHEVNIKHRLKTR